LPFLYQSGQKIRKGDKVLFHGEPGSVELVAEPPGDPETAWFVQEYGGGVMIVEPKFFGRAFLTHTESCDLVFVSRCDDKSTDQALL
jgi:hypothetical protein